MMHQPVVYVPPLPEEIDVDGIVDRKGVRFVGTARRQPNGRYVCLADVEGCLCRVEVTVEFVVS